MKDNKHIAELLGSFVAKVILICLASIIITGTVALSVKVIQGLLMWLF